MTPGLYAPLFVPEHPWKGSKHEALEDLSKNLICQWVTQGKYDFIIMMVDPLSKIAHFIPCKKATDALHIAYLFFKEIIHLHGVHKTIVSN